MLAVSSSERPKVIAKRRRGTGDALACGFDTATGDITMIDADGSPDPDEISDFVPTLFPERTSRTARDSGSGPKQQYHQGRRGVNRILNRLVNLIFRTK